MSFEIATLSTYSLGANEALGVHNHILVETSILPEAATGKLLNEYRNAVEKFKILLKNDQAEATAEEFVKIADKRRDDAYVSCLTYLGAMARSVNPEISKGSNDIKAVFDKFPDVRRVNNNTETGVLDNLIEDVSKVDSATMELTAFTPWFAELKEAQAAFVEAVHNKNASIVVKNNAALKAAKMECETALKALIKRVNALAELGSDDDSFDPTFINNVNNFIENFKSSKAAAKAADAKADETKKAKAEAAEKAEKAENAENGENAAPTSAESSVATAAGSAAGSAAE